MMLLHINLLSKLLLSGYALKAHLHNTKCRDLIVLPFKTYPVCVSWPLILEGCILQHHHSMPLSAELDDLARKEGVTDKQFHRSSHLTIHHGDDALSKPMRT